jgi:hypothetical protein
MDAGFLGTLTGPSGYADADVNAYIAAVEAADGAPLPTAIKDAINTLITGLKADSEWANINTLVMVNTAQTIAGTQIAMKGTNTASYTNVVSGDYTRGLGILGSGTKWGDTGVLQAAIGSTTSGFLGTLTADYTNQSNNVNILGRLTTDPRIGLGLSLSNNISSRLQSSTFLSLNGSLSATSMAGIAAFRNGGTLGLRFWDNATLVRNLSGGSAATLATAGNILLLVQDKTLAGRWNRNLTG